jgi:hypothetical protein
MVVFFDAGTSTYALERAAPSSVGWSLTDEGGGGGVTCFTGSNWSMGNAGADLFAYSIARDPTWTLEGRVDNRWQPIASTNGVGFVDRTGNKPWTFPMDQRPVDHNGRVPDCFWHDNPTSPP